MLVTFLQSNFIFFLLYKVSLIRHICRSNNMCVLFRMSALWKELVFALGHSWNWVCTCCQRQKLIKVCKKKKTEAVWLDKYSSQILAGSDLDFSTGLEVVLNIPDTYKRETSLHYVTWINSRFIECYSVYAGMTWRRACSAVSMITELQNRKHKVCPNISHCSELTGISTAAIFFLHYYSFLLRALWWSKI